MSGPMSAEEIVRYVVSRAVWAPSVHNTQPWRFAAVALDSQPLELPWLRGVLRTQLSDAACPHLVLRIGLVTQVALSVRRDPGDVLFPAGDDRAGPAPG
jgi:hypothetical protein